MTRPRLPSQGQLMLPLLEELRAHGGAARPRDLYDRIAERIGLSDADRAATATYAGGRTTNLFERRVRWTRQTAVAKELLDGSTRSRWELTPRGSEALQNVRRGVVITVFETDAGHAVWANAEDAAAIIDPETCDLLLTSPAYPLLRAKEYGNLPTAEWLDWMTELARGWHKLLKPTGSLVLNVGPTFEPGQPTRSPYIERLTLRLIDDLGFHLADRLYWQQPAKFANQQWVAIRRVRVRS